MLILSRKEGESIELPELGIVIHVSAIKKSRAVIGIEAPRDVMIVRSEMLDRDVATETECERVLDTPLKPSSRSKSISPTAKTECVIKEPSLDYSIPTSDDSAFFQVA